MDNEKVTKQKDNSTIEEQTWKNKETEMSAEQGQKTEEQHELFYIDNETGQRLRIPLRIH